MDRNHLLLVRLHAQTFVLAALTHKDTKNRALVLLNTLHLTLTLLSVSALLLICSGVNSADAPDPQIVGLTEPVSEVTIFTDP